MTRRILIQALVLTVFLVAVAGMMVGINYHRYTSPGPLTEPATVVIPRGASVAAIATRLAEAGIITHPLNFQIAARLSDAGLKAGEYRFEPGMSQRAVIALLSQGANVTRRLTVPEGLTAFQVIRLLGEADGLSDEAPPLPPEGSLLPETYHYALGDSRAAMLKRMNEAMRQTVDALWEQRKPGLPLASKAEAVILASIVERETGIAAERPRVAAVFINRLKKGMRLQSDPTVIYGLSNGTGMLDRALTRDDLARPTPYNTYVIDGLPPAPIANPGRASLEAVLNPAETDDLYFVADGSGGHAFARTLDEHNRNVAKWRRIERERRAAQ